MSVLASLFSGIAGINSNGSALSVSGDNISNMNTIAFKTRTALFESNLTQRIGDVEIGLGSQLAATNTAFSQGAFSSSSRSLDLAISGRGFFVVQNDQGERFYTRAGSFGQDQQGNIASLLGGYALMGYRLNETTGVAEGELSAMNINALSAQPVSSKRVSIDMNLDPNAPVIAGAFDPTSFADAQRTSNFDIPATVYDSRGTARSVVTYFRKTSENTWNFYTMTKMNNLQDGGGATVNNGGDADATCVLKAGTIAFNTDGSLSSKTYGTAGLDLWSADVAPGDAQINPGELLDTNVDIRWAGADVLDWDDFQIDFGDLTGSKALSTQFDNGGDSTYTGVETDGAPFGTLQTLEITKGGLVRGIFSNGKSRDIYKIPLASFPNEEGLFRVGSNAYQASAKSGEALISGAGTVGLGEVQAFALEQSNVDLATEFVKIIQYQRAFQASSRTVSAASDLLQDLVNLGR
jgi:flagellar hook protein FlgE